jgi:hypothetical protein
MTEAPPGYSTARENQYWVPEKLWPGETAFLFAGGTSLRGFDMARVAGRGRLLAVNSSIHLVSPFAGPLDLLYFTDTGWFDNRRKEIDAWPGMVFSSNRRAKGWLPDRVKRVQLFDSNEFNVPGRVKNGRSSGHVAVSLAISLGAARAVLLGYDMHVTSGGRSHHHDDYDRPAHPDTYSKEFIPSFDGWDAAARRAGTEVLNCTPGSSLKEFSTAPLETVCAA